MRGHDDDILNLFISAFDSVLFRPGENGILSPWSQIHLRTEKGKFGLQEYDKPCVKSTITKFSMSGHVLSNLNRRNSERLGNASPFASNARVSIINLKNP